MGAGDAMIDDMFTAHACHIQKYVFFRLFVALYFSSHEFLNR
jgi:hypothetical protein